MIVHAYVRYKLVDCTFPYVLRVQHEVSTTQLQRRSTPKIFVRLKKKNLGYIQDISMYQI
jgi:hypothetical protein